MREPDPGTVRAAAGGDRRALAELIVAYQDPVWRYLTRLIGDRHLAEDLTQETFLRVHRGLAGFEHRARFSTWVFGIARNVGIDSLRRRDRRPTTVGLDELGPAVTGPADTATELAAAIESLPVAQREALLLVEVLGLTYREVAGLTGTPAGTVKSRVHHARRHLDDWLHAGDDNGHQADQRRTGGAGARRAR